MIKYIAALFLAVSLHASEDPYKDLTPDSIERHLVRLEATRRNLMVRLLAHPENEMYKTAYREILAIMAEGREILARKKDGQG